MYRPTTLKVTITVFPSVFLSHLLRKSIPSLPELFTCFKKGFNKVSTINSLSFLVGHLGPPTIGLTLSPAVR